VLNQYVLNPQKFPDDVYSSDENTVVIFDKYPKAKFHFLVMPSKIVGGYSNLTSDSVDMLKKMKKKADSIVEEYSKKHPKLSFRIGFHAIPSLSQLHMHVISQDFDSECLKNKKHWNSFTTEFFIDANDFIRTLAKDGEISFDKTRYENMLQRDLQCHRCKAQMGNMTKLKQHIQNYNRDLCNGGSKLE